MHLAGLTYSFRYFVLIISGIIFCYSLKISPESGYIQSLGIPIRSLGGYERLLARKSPSSNQVALSHGCAVHIRGQLSNEEMHFALLNVILRHPMLRTRISSPVDEGKDIFWEACKFSNDDLISRILKPIQVDSCVFDSVWKSRLEESVNGAVFPDDGPLWRLLNIVAKDGEDTNVRSAWIFTMNHGIDDQQSVDIVVNDMIQAVNSYRSDQKLLPPSLPFPKSIEQAVSPQLISWNMILWSMFQLGNSLAAPKLLPKAIIRDVLSEKNPVKNYVNPNKRTTILEYFAMNNIESSLSRLRDMCRLEQVTVTHLLAALVTCATLDVINKGEGSEDSGAETEKLRFLLSVGLRPFGEENVKSGRKKDPQADFTQQTVACAGGAVDYILGVCPHAHKYFRHLSGVAAIAANEEGLERCRKSFWDLARESRRRSQDIIDRGWVTESVRLFGFGMRFADVLKVVEMDAASAGTLGRGYSCGVSNVGYQRFSRTEAGNPVEVEKVFYCTSHSRNGVLVQLSSISTETHFCGCLQFVEPIVSRQDALDVRSNLEIALHKLCTN